MAIKNYYYNPINNVIGIKTNIKDFRFSYGMSMPTVTIEEFDRCKIKISLQIVADSVKPTSNEKEKMGKFHYFNGHNNQKELYYERSFFFNRTLQFRVTGIDTNEITMEVNKDYYRTVKHRFMNIHSVGYILTDIINLRLLHNNLAPLHCSSFSKNGESYVIFAPPNTGKTLTAMTLCMKDNKNYAYMSEDLAITNGKELYSVPWTSTFRYYDTVDSRWFSRTLNRLTEKVSVLELFGLGKTDPITKYVDNIQYTAPINGIFILDRGEKFINDISNKEAFDRINTLDRYEFNYMRAPTIIAYEYFNRETDIETAYSNERKILKEMISNAKFVRVISSNSALDYAQMIENTIENA